jgi:hypothetical protein
LREWIAEELKFSVEADSGADCAGICAKYRRASVFRILRLVLAAILIAAFAGVTSARDHGERSIGQ